MPEGLRPALRLYRNNDQEFERLLSKSSAERKIPITMSLRPTADGFCLSAGDVSVSLTVAHQEAEKPQRENIVRQLTKLGGTPYECREVELPDGFNYFIPSSLLAELRRRLVEGLISRYEVRGTSHLAPRKDAPESNLAPRSSTCSHLDNIANREACRFYGVEAPTAYELHPTADAVLMQCRHCLRYSLGYCVKHGGQRPTWREPLFLRLGDGRRFRLEFDCRNCQMNVYAATR
jgi:putative protease